MKPIVRQSFVSAAFALGLVAAPVAGGLALLVPSAAHAQQAPTLETMKQTLGQYGQFITHAKHGEVWKPAVTPRGWHPYPACDWVFTKDYGWYFSDKTPWGSIVHHYGRWFHDEVDGWLWQPGLEFSPGWVMWRTSAEWVGWAPTPPDVEITPANMEKFDDDKLWTFMEAKKFGATCEGGSAAQYPAFYGGTNYVTDVRFVGGIGVFVLPPDIVGPVVKVDVDVFAPWTVNFIGSWVWNWTNIFNDVDIKIVVKNCGPNDPKNPKEPKEPKEPKDPQQPPITHNDPPPPPPGLNDRGPGPRRTQGDRPNLRRPTPDWRSGIRGFDPAPDDVVIGGGRPPLKLGGRRPGGGQGFRPQREFGPDFDRGRPPVVSLKRPWRGGREIDPGFSRPKGQSFGSFQKFGGHGLGGRGGRELRSFGGRGGGFQSMRGFGRGGRGSFGGGGGFSRMQ